MCSDNLGERAAPTKTQTGQKLDVGGKGVNLGEKGEGDWKGADLGGDGDTKFRD